MFDQIMGLPAHPLMVHFAVVLTPLLALLTVAYALLPGRRPLLAWAVVLLSLASPAALFAAKQSGELLKEARFATAEGELGQAIATHESFASPLLLSAVGLGATALLLVYVTTPARAGSRKAATGVTVPADARSGDAGPEGTEAGRTTGDRFGRAVTIGLSALAVVLAAVVAYYVFQAGDSGARAVWGLGA
ncbi:hypothetical protein [Nonomuraea lactucae]|uniref:hypothetical protein n=1 Tax=Nonomuraea lactucae TaxID=2249762 RepID=UPI000DE3D89D|nr:hypothetical protein [Nonomuraea lactucae]